MPITQIQTHDVDSWLCASNVHILTLVQAEGLDYEMSSNVFMNTDMQNWTTSVQQSFLIY